MWGILASPSAPSPKLCLTTPPRKRSKKQGPSPLARRAGTFNIQSFTFPCASRWFRNPCRGKKQQCFHLIQVFTCSGTAGLLDTGNFLIPVSGSGVYGCQAFTGSWNIQLPLMTADIISASPNLPLPSVNSPRQWAVELCAAWITKSCCPRWDWATAPGATGTTNYSWNQTSVVAMAVPEPGTLLLGVLLLPFGAKSLWNMRHRPAASRLAPDTISSF